MIPSPSDLTYFIEVANTQNLSRAAEKLGISQPSLTIAIQRLEVSVGINLLNRSKKGVSLTQGGKQLLIHAHDLLQKWEHVKSKAVASTNEIQGFYSIGCHVSVGLYSLARFLPKLMDQNPKIEIRLVHELSRKIVEKVIQMEVDIGIAVNPVKHPDLVIRTLCLDEVTLWAAKGYLQDKEKRVGSSVLICDPDLLQTQDILKKMKKAGIEFRRTITTSSLEVITKLVSSGAGVGLIPGRVVEASGYKDLVRVPKAPIFKDEICLLYRIENKNVRAIKFIGDQIQIAFTGPFPSL